MADIITADLVALDASFGQTKDDVIVGLTQLVADAGRSDQPGGAARATCSPARPSRRPGCTAASPSRTAGRST